MDKVTDRKLNVLGKSTVNVYAHKPLKISAQVFPSTVAPATVTASEIEIADDSIALVSGGDALAYLDHFTSYLMADNAGESHVPEPPLLDVDNREPSAAGSHPHQRLTRTDLGSGHLFVPECSTSLIENHCFHILLPVAEC